MTDESRRITSSANKRVKNLVALLNKSRERKGQDVFVTEGIKMFLEAPSDRIKEVYISQSLWKKEEAAESLLWKKIITADYYILDDDVFKKASDTKTPQGILCLIRQFHYSLTDILEKENPLYLIMEDIQDPGNLGTMIRTAEGAGVDGIIMSSNTVDIYNPKTIRATMGSVYRMPFIYVDDLVQKIKVLQKKGVKVYAAHLEGQQHYFHENYCRASAFLIGNEGNGLKEETACQADCYIKIPMAGRVESLNAAVASVILMYEASRQRMENF